MTWYTTRPADSLFTESPSFPRDIIFISQKHSLLFSMSQYKKSAYNINVLQHTVLIHIKNKVEVDTVKHV